MLFRCHKARQADPDLARAKKDVIASAMQARDDLTRQALKLASEIGQRLGRLGDAAQEAHA